MANITLSISDFIKTDMEKYDEIRWSEVAKKAIMQKLYELRKLEILRKYVDKQPFSDDDVKWMDENDWHPVDEKPMKKEFVSSVLEREKGSFKRTTISELLR